MDVRASQDTLIEIFERMENFFQRLEIYTEVSPTPEMMDIIMKIMVEVLYILGIATKEVRQGRTSEYASATMSPLAEKCLEKYLKKLVGRTDMEDALKKLDKLTIEEARMATAQTLKATHAVDGRVRGVDDKVLEVKIRVAGVDNKVAGVDKRVAGVDDKVAGVVVRVASVDNKVDNVEVRVASVDDKVKAVDNKVAVVIDGAQVSSISHQENIYNRDVSRWKRGEGSLKSSETFVILSP